jgi:hypothetical protein
MFAGDLTDSTDRLEQALLARERLITWLRTEQAKLLRRLDEAQVHHSDGARTLKEWVAARLDVNDATAKDLVFASKALPDYPEIAQRIDRDEVSFDRAVATTKLALAGAEPATIERSFGFDLDGVARLTSRHRRLSRRDEAEAFRDRFLAIQPNLAASSGRIWGQLPGFELRIVGKALDERGDMFNDLPGPRLARGQRMADALVSIAQDSLQVNGWDDEAPPERSDPLVTVFVDADLAGRTRGAAGAEIEFGPKVGPMTLQRILCTGAVQFVGLDAGRPVVASDAARGLPAAVRRFVVWRDGGCTVDGCTSRYRLQPHHLTPWAAGGGHDVDNLTTLCWYHHHVVVHGMGYRLDPDSPPQRQRFLTPTARGP